LNLAHSAGFFEKEKTLDKLSHLNL